MPPMRFSSPASLYALVGWISASVLQGRLPVVSGPRSQIHRFTSYNVKLTTVKNLLLGSHGVPAR
eukprot:scaffold33185_cov101-Isochrysis_galbana.AAC.4